MIKYRLVKIQISTSNCNLYLFYLVEHEQSQFLVKAIKHHHLFESSPILVQVCCLWHLQQWVHVSRKPIITDIVKILYGFIPVANLQTSRFKQINKIFRRLNCFVKGIRLAMLKSVQTKNASHYLSIVKRLGED